MRTRKTILYHRNHPPYSVMSGSPIRNGGVNIFNGFLIRLGILDCVKRLKLISLPELKGLQSHKQFDCPCHQANTTFLGSVNIVGPLPKLILDILAS